MMKIPFSIGEKHFNIKPYKTHQEKDLLLMQSFGVNDQTRVLDLLDYESESKASDLTSEEYLTLLLKYREISLGDEREINFTCDECGLVQDGVLELGNVLINPIRNDEDIKKKNVDVTDDNLKDFVGLTENEIDDLDIDQYETLKQRVKDNQISFNFKKSCSCIRCGKQKHFFIGDVDFVISCMSDDTLMTIYKSISDMIFFSHYTKYDIDNMYPFERAILRGLLIETKQEMNK